MCAPYPQWLSAADTSAAVLKRPKLWSDPSHPSRDPSHAVTNAISGTQQFYRLSQ